MRISAENLSSQRSTSVGRNLPTAWSVCGKGREAQSGRFGSSKGFFDVGQNLLRFFLLHPLHSGRQENADHAASSSRTPCSRLRDWRNSTKSRTTLWVTQAGTSRCWRMASSCRHDDHLPPLTIPADRGLSRARMIDPQAVYCPIKARFVGRDVFSRADDEETRW